ALLVAGRNVSIDEWGEGRELGLFCRKCSMENEMMRNGPTFLFFVRSVGTRLQFLGGRSGGASRGTRSSRFLDFRHVVILFDHHGSAVAENFRDAGGDFIGVVA